MPTPADHADTRDGLTLLLGPRQADIMRLFWAHGPATVRQVHQQLAKDADLAYTTVATLCVRMAEKGLLLQQRLEVLDQRGRHVMSYVYTPLITEAEFVRAAVTQQLDRLLAYYPDLVYSYVAQHVQRAGAGGSDEDANDHANVERSQANLAPPARRQRCYPGQRRRADRARRGRRAPGRHMGGAGPAG